MGVAVHARPSYQNGKEPQFMRRGDVPVQVRGGNVSVESQRAPPPPFSVSPPPPFFSSSLFLLLLPHPLLPGGVVQEDGPPRVAHARQPHGHLKSLAVGLAQHRLIAMGEAMLVSSIHHVFKRDYSLEAVRHAEEVQADVGMSLHRGGPKRQRGQRRARASACEWGPHACAPTGPEEAPGPRGARERA